MMMNREMNKSATPRPLIEAAALQLQTPAGRALVRDLHLSLSAEHAAIVGRNGVGKSSLLEVLAGREQPHRGRVRCHTERVLVRQELEPRVEPAELCALFGCSARQLVRDPQVAAECAAAGLRPPASYLRDQGMSRGERRKWHLLAARHRRPGLLLLDEPTQDMDSAGIDWLLAWLDDWRGGLLVVSHHRRLLQRFRHFFIFAEAGCSYFMGSFERLEDELQRRHIDGQKQYLRKLNVLLEQERHNATVCRRRRRKKNLGRLHEEARAPSRAQLRGKKSYAQQSQGKAAKLRQARLKGVRQWARAARRALSVQLPLRLPSPQLPPDEGHARIALRDVAVVRAERTLFSGVNVRLGRDRLGVVGPNGAGKTTLLRVMSGTLAPGQGSAQVGVLRLGCIAQGAPGWCSQESLAERLMNIAELPSAEALAQLLVAHRFPLALAQRPLQSLSPGERVRAALICLFQRTPVVEVLVLDEPTYCLDFMAAAALGACLRSWPGGLVVASHDRAFLQSIGIARLIELDGRGGHRVKTM